MDDSGFFSIQVSMKRSFVGLMVVVGGEGVNIHLIQQGRGLEGPGSPPLFFGQTEAQRAEKVFWRPTPLISRSGAGTVQWFGSHFSNN